MITASPLKEKASKKTEKAERSKGGGRSTKQSPREGSDPSGKTVQCPHCPRMFFTVAQMSGHKRYCKKDAPVPIGMSKVDKNYVKNHRNDLGALIQSPSLSQSLILSLSFSISLSLV